MEYEQAMNKHYEAKIQFVIEQDRELLEEIDKYERQMFKIIGTRNLDGNNPDNDVESHKRKFAYMETVMEDHGFNNVGQMTLRKFYTTVHYLEEKAEKLSRTART